MTVSSEVLIHKCRRRAASPKNKTINTAYCESPCRHIVEINNKKCVCCGKPLTHKQTFEAFMQKFDQIIADNQFFLDGHKIFPAKLENSFYAMVKNGYFTYFVHTRYFIEYMDLSNADGDDKYNRFFNSIIKNCPRIGGRLVNPYV